MEALGNKILWKSEARQLKNPVSPLVHWLKGAGSELFTFNCKNIGCGMWESVTFSRFDRREVRASHAHMSVYTLVNSDNGFLAKLSSCDAFLFPCRKTQSISSSGELNGLNPVPLLRRPQELSLGREQAVGLVSLATDLLEEGLRMWVSICQGVWQVVAVVLFEICEM